MNINRCLSPLRYIYYVAQRRRAQKSIKRIAELVEVALPIVRELSTIKPHEAKLEDLLDAYHHHGIKIKYEYFEDAQSIGNALFNLATEILRHRLPVGQEDTPTHLLNSAVQISCTLIKAK